MSIKILSMAKKNQSVKFLLDTWVILCFLRNKNIHSTIKTIEHISMPFVNLYRIFF